jgi:hypothetical protein
MVVILFEKRAEALIRMPYLVTKSVKDKKVRSSLGLEYWRELRPCYRVLMLGSHPL